MATDRWGHEAVLHDGKPVIRHYYREDDGWGFMKSGPKRSIVVDVYDAARAEAAIRASGMKPAIIDDLIGQLKAGKQELSYYLDREWAWPEKK